MNKNPAMRFWLAVVLLMTVCPSLCAQKQLKKKLTIVAVSYEIVPQETTTYSHTPGHSSTDCSGTDSGGSVNMDCTTTTTPSQTHPVTINRPIVYNRVESNGMIYTIVCAANWAWSKCATLNPGDDFPAEIDGQTMWIEAARGGNQGKRVKVKYTILDVRAKLVERTQAPSPVPAASSDNTPSATLLNHDNATVVCLPGQTSVALKKDPTKESTAYSELACGTQVKVLSRSEGFATVLTADFHKGFVDSENILTPESNK